MAAVLPKARLRVRVRARARARARVKVRVKIGVLSKARLARVRVVGQSSRPCLGPRTGEQ